MNYQRIYNSIIERAKNRPLICGYVEKHHIIPKCLEGTDDKSNIAVLTLEEHFVCHQLLTKIYPENGRLLYALTMMCKGQKRHSNKMFGWIKRKRSRPKILKTCKQCSTQFLARESTKKELCSIECRDNFTLSKRLKWKCECCNREFTASKSHIIRRFCSEECRLKTVSTKHVISSCEQCGVELRIVDSQKLRGKKYCSSMCKGLARRRQSVSKCEVCTKEFSHLAKSTAANKFCSRGCYNSTRRITQPCKHCNKEFTSEKNLKRSFCSRQCYLGK